MLKTLKDLFDTLRAPEPAETPAEREHLLQLATGVMLVEVMRADSSLDAVEREAIVAALHERFALGEDEVQRLLELAQQAAHGATDYFSFTSRINEGFDMAQKLQIVEHMWRVAYADGTLSAHENHLMRKVAELLYIPHGAYVHAKMRAQAGGGA